MKSPLQQFLDRLSNDLDDAANSDEHGVKLAEDTKHAHDAQVTGGSRGQVEAHQDDKQTNSVHNLNFAKTGGFYFAHIIYCQPYTHWYRVRLDDLEGERRCCAIAPSGLLPLSTRSTSPYPPGQAVLVWEPEEGTYGYIVGSVPDKIEDGGMVHPDVVVQGSNVGFKREDYYNKLYEYCALDGSAVDFSNNRPWDALAIGEWGQLSDLGGGVFSDLFQSFIRAGDSCGLWCFYMDQLARLCGHNLDIRTAISEMMVRDDSGEGLCFNGSTAYPFEANGAWEFGTDTGREETDEDVQYKKPYSKVEPAEDDQQPFYRLEEWRGYLGQAYMRHLMAPPPGASGLNKFDDTDERVGLFREQLSLDGAWAVTSAHSISITKRLLIPIPKRLKMPEDKTGDRLEPDDFLADFAPGDYKFSGIHGQGDDHKVESLLSKDDLPHLHMAAALDDWLAHAFNWKGLHPFHYHKKDFDTPEEGDLNFTKIQYQIPFGELLSDQWLSAPTAETVDKIDHRYDGVDYFPTTAGFFLLPHGGVVIRGGQGEEIRMTGGSVQISCPGDTWLQPGKNVNLYAGDDLIAKAKNSMDFTATQHDVRFKASRNMEFLAGNNTAGGRMLFENKSPGDSHDISGAVGEDLFGSGFVFKAKNSSFITAVKGIYLRTGSPDGEVSEGPIVLDAAKGKQDIRTVSNNTHHHIQGTLTDAFPVAGTKDVVNKYNAGEAIIGTNLCVDGLLRILRQGAVIRGNVNIVGGHIGTEEAIRKPHLGVVKGSSLQQSLSSLDQCEARVEACKIAERSDYEDQVEAKFYNESNLPGHGDFQKASSFSLRSQQQLNTNQFKLPEVYWQMLAENTGQVQSTWLEEIVTYNGEDMMPHPGIKKWSEEPGTFHQFSGDLYDPTEGKDKDREGGTYEDPTLKDFTKVVPDGTYPVNAN